jgi:hypothetical protein
MAMDNTWSFAGCEVLMEIPWDIRMNSASWIVLLEAG